MGGLKKLAGIFTGVTEKLDDFAASFGTSEEEIDKLNAGYALSNSSIFDLVVRFCVEREIYDLHDVNALLLQADQKSLAKEAA